MRRVKAERRGRPGVASALMGVNRAAQVADSATALDLSSEHRAALDAASAPADPRLIYGSSRPPLRQHVVFGGSDVRTAAEAAHAGAR